MNVLGHPYIAWKVFEDFNEDHLAGSWLPDLSPFVPNSVFEFEEIHEGGEKFWHFLQQNYPDRQGLALGMLSHGVTYGADKFSRMLESRYESHRKRLTELILQSTPNITEEVASKYRFHNFLWWGIDVQILENALKFKEILTTLIPKVRVEEITHLIAKCFEKPETEVRRMLDWLFTPVALDNLTSIEGLARGWRVVARGLPEKDDVNIKKTVAAFKFCAQLMENDWQEIVDKVAIDVRINLLKFM